MEFHLSTTTCTQVERWGPSVRQSIWASPLTSLCVRPSSPTTVTSSPWEWTLPVYMASSMGKSQRGGTGLESNCEFYFTFLSLSQSVHEFGPEANPVKSWEAVLPVLQADSDQRVQRDWSLTSQYHRHHHIHIVKFCIKITSPHKINVAVLYKLSH